MARSWSRRSFIRQSLLTAGAVAVTPMSCRSDHLAHEADREADWQPAYLALGRSGELTRRAEQLWQVFESCECCPRACAANRLAGESGVVTWVARELGPNTAVNIMDQYRPMHRAREYPEINRRISSGEWAEALTWARNAGLTALL